MAEKMTLVNAIKPQAGAAITGKYVNTENVGTLFVNVHINQANAAAVAITIEQATSAAGAGSKVITKNVPIFVNQTAETTSVFTRPANGVAFTTSTDTDVKLVVFQIDPATLDIAGGFKYVTVKTAASNAANITSATYELTQERYKSIDAPNALT